jgi:short subunit dehydrogenase-like uncharacterized protein
MPGNEAASASHSATERPDPASARSTGLDLPARALATTMDVATTTRRGLLLVSAVTVFWAIASEMRRAGGIVVRMTVVLYGATGYTGALVADELERRGLEHVLSGRDPVKLARLGDERGVPARAASLDDEPALRGLLDEASAVINCAGPFTLSGDALLRAAIDTGTHYVDSTGEQAFIRLVFDRHGPAAEKAGVALVPALGFDYAPGDCIARLAASGHEPLEELVLAYAVQGFGMSRGTMRSALEAAKGGDVVYEDGEWRPAPSGVFRASFDFTEPIGRQPMSRYASGEVITVPRHTRTKRVVSLITSRTVIPNAVAARLLPYLQPPLELSMRTPLRGLLSHAVDPLPVGPPEAARRAAEFTIVAVARGEDGSTVRAIVRGLDVYGLAAVTLVHGAELMSAPGYDRAGALGPAAAFDPQAFLDHMGDHGVAWQLAPREVSPSIPPPAVS